MKFAMVDGVRKEPATGLLGTCAGCGQPTLSKCGQIKVHHWAHKSKLECDPWWENETEWHRKWKGNFPESWQEVVHRAENGEFHRADVKTDKSWVLEFQYSSIAPEERTSRNDFYKKIVWIVNGLRRKNDSSQFFNALKFVKKIEDSTFRRVFEIISDKSALMREWSNDKSPVFFDFNEPEVLWCLLPKAAEGKLVMAEILRQRFIELHLSNSNSPNDIFGELFNFAAAATSAEDLFLKFHYLRRAEDKHRQLIADEARRRNPYINHRARFRL